MKPLVAIVIVLSTLLGACVSRTGTTVAQPSNATSPLLAPDAYPLPMTFDATGASIDAPAGALAASAALDKATAVAIAAKAAGKLANPDNPLTAQLVVYTSGRESRQSDGTMHPVVDHSLVWLIRFTGTPQPVYGPRGADGRPLASPAVVATELNVVVDAASGEVLEMFSYQ